MSLPEATREAWSPALTETAADFDLSDPDDRAAFRGAVARRMGDAKLFVIQQIALALSVPKTDLGRLRSRATRAVADAWIAGRRL